MLARVATFAIDGVDPRQVWVEVDIRSGLPAFTIVGLGDTAVRESRDRDPRGDPQLRASASPRPDHRQPRPGVPAQGGPGLRRRARAGPAGGQRPGPGGRRSTATRCSASCRSAASCATRPGALAVAEGARRAGLRAADRPARARRARRRWSTASRSSRWPNLRGGRRGPGGRARRRRCPDARAGAGPRAAEPPDLRRRPRPRGAAAGAADRRRRRPQPAAGGRARAPARRCSPGGCRRSCPR